MKSSPGKMLALVFTGLVAGFACTMAVATDAYPVKVVKLVTHSNPGSGSDVFLRRLSTRLGAIMGVKFIVVNEKGGSGSRAMALLAESKPDGSIFYATTPTFIFTSQLSSPKYTYKDLEPVVNVFSDQEILYTRADGPYKTLKDVMDHAREGRGRWGAANPGSLERQALERLKEVSKVQAGVVTHSGGGELLINVLNGTLDVGVGEYQELLSQVQSGQIRLLAVFADKRMQELPNLPTVKESGYDVTVHKFRGIAGPKGLPPNVIAAWEKGVQAVLKDPAYMKIYKEDALTPDYMSHADYVPFIAKFAADSATFFKTHGVTQ
ncbi:tripartite tricarboxylate transporter substrate binding protein [Pinirhizobacter sp.]|jgi:tripartite-type tricarboxylate transporter receptor subunit TctC|uniref:Bug family tripartite tricarboxylate transporter substrate binding protein n=1 Tax=Pinirhizobacter sp. TaxID=2950432 RepID=UPI002F40A11F